MSGASKTMQLAHNLADAYLAALVGRAEGQKRHIPSGFKTLDASIGGWLGSRVTRYRWVDLRRLAGLSDGGAA